MEAVQLFLDIGRPDLNNEWNAKVTERLKALSSVEKVIVTAINSGIHAQVNINYKPEELPFTQIEKVVVESGATVTDINIHFPSSVTGIADPYGSSAISIPIEDNMKKIEGVLGGAISDKGVLKVVLDTTANDKQCVIDEVLKTYSCIRSGKTTL
mgnify:FL=1